MPLQQVFPGGLAGSHPVLLPLRPAVVRRGALLLIYSSGNKTPLKKVLFESRGERRNAKTVE